MRGRGVQANIWCHGRGRVECDELRRRVVARGGDAIMTCAFTFGRATMAGTLAIGCTRRVTGAESRQCGWRRRRCRRWRGRCLARTRRLQRRRRRRRLARTCWRRRRRRQGKRRCRQSHRRRRWRGRRRHSGCGQTRHLLTWLPLPWARWRRRRRHRWCWRGPRRRQTPGVQEHADTSLIIVGVTADEQ